MRAKLRALAALDRPRVAYCSLMSPEPIGYLSSDQVAISAPENAKRTLAAVDPLPGLFLPTRTYKISVLFYARARSLRGGQPVLICSRSR